MTKGREANSKPRHTWIPAKQAEWQITAIRPSPENNRVYRPVLPDDPEIQDLSANIKERGVLQPLVISEDGFIISGHRRHVAAQLAGLITVPCVVEPIRHDDDPEAFLQLLVSHNKQRVKTHDERVREELVNIDPDDAYNRLLSHRHKRSKIEMAPMAILGAKTRSEISAAKQPFLAAIKRVLNDLQDFWPLSDRQIHYGLLNDPPLRHARKPGSRYVNDKKSYNDLVDLLTRARLANEIPWNAIDDETRPVEVWSVHQDPSGFIRAETSEFLFGYWRDLMQSQPNHVEILAEKNTVKDIVRPVAMEFCIPLTSGRGYSSLPPRKAMADRYRDSGKEQLVLLVVSDFDPDGEEIAHSFARSMRDDFGVIEIHPVKAALTAEQVQKFKLPNAMEAKATSSNAQKFVKKYGKDVFELEALPPATLQHIIKEAILGVIDVDAYNREVEQEKEDAAYIAAKRSAMLKSLGDGV